MKILIPIAALIAVAGAVSIIAVKSKNGDPYGASDTAANEKFKRFKEKFGCRCCRDCSNEDNSCDQTPVDDGNDF